jgi:hypothetical protein
MKSDEECAGLWEGTLKMPRGREIQKRDSQSYKFWRLILHLKNQILDCLGDYFFPSQIHI